MKPVEKRMLIALVILVALLAVKSTVLDPFQADSADKENYAQYARMMAPFQNQTMLDRMRVLTYRTVSVERTEESGETRIVVLDPETDDALEATLTGEYQAVVRSYLFWIIPVGNIQIEGGFPGIEDENED